MARTDLGDMEHLVMLAILRLGKDAYGIPILDEVSARVKEARAIIRHVHSAVKGWRELALEAGVSKKEADHIAGLHCLIEA